MATNVRFSKAVCQMLATLCSLDRAFVEAAVAVPLDQHYRRITIPKKSGGRRVLHEPCQAFKIVQESLLEYLYKTFVMDRRMFGYIPKRSIVQNARYHLWRHPEHYHREILRPDELIVPRQTFQFDLKDAFPSVKRPLLTEMFEMIFPLGRVHWLIEGDETKTYREFIELLLSVTTHQDCLPQGAGTSPYLLNLAIQHTGVLKRIKEELGDGFHLSIYADDFTISKNWIISRRFQRRMLKAVEAGGPFRINPDKTRVNDIRYKAHQITGVVLTTGGDGQPKLTLAQKTRNRLRGAIFRATLALEEGRPPILGQDGITLAQAHSYVGWIREIYDRYTLPSDVGTVVVNFEIAYSYYKSNKETF